MPVTLPPGRARLSTRPASTGLSPAPSKTMGIVLVALIAARTRPLRNRQADLLGGFEIDYELKLRRLLHRQIGRFRAFQNLVHVDSGTFETLSIAVGIGHEAADLHVCIYL